MSTSSTANTTAVQPSATATATGSGSPLEDFHLSSSQLSSLLDSKDDAVQVLKSELMDALNKEVKSLDEDSWMFEGPRSRVNLISKPGSSFSLKNSQPASHWNSGLPKAYKRSRTALPPAD